MVKTKAGILAMPATFQKSSSVMAEQKLVKIKMLRGVTGSDLTGRPFTASAGSEVEVPEDFAADLTRDGVHAMLMEAGKQNTAAKQKPETR